MYQAELQLSIALSLAVIIQIVAHHIKIPSIIMLLITGVVCGPECLAILDPHKLGQPLIHGMISFAVAIILFEGGLALDIKRLRREKQVIRNLISIGALMTLCGTLLSTHYILDWKWKQSFLLSTLVVVTGPTVVTPLLKRMKVKHHIASILEAEGVLIDAVGAIIATVGLTVALSAQGSMLQGGLAFIETLAVGIILGGITGAIIHVFLGHNLIPSHIEKMSVLGLMIGLFQASNYLIHESGVAAVISAGVYLAAQKNNDYQELKEFKEQLTLFFIGLLFVVLATDIHLQEIYDLGAPGVAVALSIVFVIRPLSVYISTIGSQLNFKERLFIGMIGPRGIIAAAVASMFASRMQAKGLAGGNELRALVFLVICLSVLSAAVIGPLLGHWFKLRKPAAKGWLILGANPLAMLMSSALQHWGSQARLIDSNRDRINQAESNKHTVTFGNAFEEKTLKRAQIEDYEGVIGMIGNAELNWLFVSKVKQYFKSLKHAIILKKDLVAHSAMGKVSELSLKQEAIDLLLGARIPVSYWQEQIDKSLGSWVEVEWSNRTDDQKEAMSFINEDYQGLALLHKRQNKINLLHSNTVVKKGDKCLFWVLDEHVVEVMLLLSSCGWDKIK
jgi:NhaP-type Na+/H+ or K+/H+ antiporter